MTKLTYSGDSNFASEEIIKDNLLKIFIIYSTLSILFLIILNISGIRLFNSLNLTMTLVSGGGFLPSDSLSDIISTNFQKIAIMITFIFTILNFYILLNIFNKSILLKEHKEDFYLFILMIVLGLFAVNNII